MRVESLSQVVRLLYGLLYEHIPKNVEDNENFKLLWYPESMVWIPHEAKAVRPSRSEFIKGPL